jgi:serine/threonine-protein kinase
MMYEMLCGRVPFDRGAGVGTLMAHVHNEPPPFQAHQPDLVVSPAMEAIVFRCLEKDPERRFPSMNDLLVALKNFAGDDSLVNAHDSGANSLLGSHPPRSAVRVTGVPSQPEATPYPRGVMRRDSTGPQTMAPQTVRSGYPSAPPSAAPPSNSDISPGPAPFPDPSLLIEAPPPKKRVLPWVIAGAAVAIAGVAVVMSRGPVPGQGDGPAGAAAPVATTAAPVAPVATTAAPAAPAAPSAPLERKVRVESSPPGAAVLENGKAVCNATPCEVTWKGDEAKADHKLTFSKGGFKASVVTVKPADEKATVALERAQAATKQGGFPDGYKDAY